MRVFKDKEKLQKMLSLYKKNNRAWNIDALSIKYLCDRDTIRYHLKKHKLYKRCVDMSFMKDRIQNKRIRDNEKLLDDLYIIKPNINEIGEAINQGKTYQEYLDKK